MKRIRQQFADTMLAVGNEDDKLVVMVGDISHGILQPFAKAHPDRYYNTGILEQTLMSMAAGLARTGLYPVLHTITPFVIERAFEQLKLDFCYQKLHGNIVTVGSAFDYAALGCTHHCYGDFALLKTLEGVDIVYPGSAQEFDALFRQCYRNDRLTYFRIPERGHGYGIVSPAFGAGVRYAEGNDVTIISTGPHLHTAMEAGAMLDRQHGISAEVLYIHTIRPLDTEMITQSVAKTKRVVVVEEHMRSGGLGDDVLRTVNGIDCDFKSVSILDRFVRDYGTYDDHCKALGFTAENVAKVAERLCTR